MKLEFFQQIFQKYSYQISCEFVTKLFHMDGWWYIRKDMTKLMITFHNFVNAPKSAYKQYTLCVYLSPFRYHLTVCMWDVRYTENLILVHCNPHLHELKWLTQLVFKAVCSCQQCIPKETTVMCNNYRQLQRTYFETAHIKWPSLGHCLFKGSYYTGQQGLHVPMKLGAVAGVA